MTSVIIDKSKAKVYAPIGDALGQFSRTTTTLAAADVSIVVQNVTGFAVDDYILIGEVGKEKSEIAQISAITSKTLTVGALSNSYDKKTSIRKLEYNQIRFYADDAVSTTETIISDHYISSAIAISNTVKYSIAYYNSQTSTEGPRGLKVDGYDTLLNEVQDMRLHDNDIDTYGINLIPKIELARNDIRRLMLQQEIDFDEIDAESLKQLTYPAAILSVIYVYKELVKKEMDWASLKLRGFEKDYKISIKITMETLGDTKNVLQGQTRCVR